MSYFDELTKSMTWLGEQKDTIFLGQSVEYPGNALYRSLEGVPMEKRVEMPVAEDMQMGIAIGLSLQGYVPICIFPRFDFLLCAVNQLVNHLDKIEEYSNGAWKPKVIIRTCVGSTKPLYPGVQHCGGYTVAFRKLLHNILVINNITIMAEYMWAYEENHNSTILVEEADLYEV